MSEHIEGNDRTAGWLKRYNSLRDSRAIWDTAWQEIAEHIFTRKAGITQKDYTPANQRDARLYDITGMDAIERAVAGYMSWTTDKTQPWMEFTPILAFRNNDAVKNWLRECSMLAAEYIANSNFYAERHESLFDLWGFGTSCLFSQVTPDNQTRFEKIKIGSYVFDTDHNGAANCVMREFEMTARQAEGKFGRDELPIAVREAFDNGSEKKFTFIHIVEPRPVKERGNDMGMAAGKKKAFVSAYVEKQSQKIVQESGFDSFPFHVGRFLKWDALDVSDMWGYGPGFSILPESRQLNFMQKMMDVYAEKTVFPPMMVPDTFEGTLKTSARAMNYYGAGLNPDSIYPLNVSGDWSMAMERVKMRQEMIRRRCHLDMFQMFSMNAANNREMTAFEAGQLAGEKLDAISPAFDRDTTDTIQPMMIRLFESWAENGMLPAPPPESVQQIGPNLIQVPNPVITMTNRLALALRGMSLRAADTMVQKIASLAQVFPEIVDEVNPSWFIRESSRLAGVDPSFLRPQEEVDAIRQGRAQAMQAQQQMAMMQQAAGAVKDIGGVDKVKEVAQAMM